VSRIDSALLRALRSSEVHLPRGELARLLHTTDQAVSQAVDVLRGAGFEIDERPALGYRIVAAPDRLIADDLHALLGPSDFATEILVFEETDSTNERLLQLGAKGARSGLVLFAERQTGGRGRFSRRWESASHRGLWFSVLVRPKLPLSEWPRITTWAAVVAAQAVERCTGLRPLIKWPNDLELNGRKTAGILIETAADQNGQPFAVLGVGFNVNQSPEDFPESIRSTATSLRIAVGALQDRVAIAVELLRSFSENYIRLAQDFPSIVNEARALSSLLGRHVTLQSATMRVEGIAEDLAEDGRLMIRLGDGRLESFSGGEVSVVRN
jgi:BirA family biotin operon repressor/biotin-[acetyl-CoA-carboxylase] ligase